MGQYLIPNATSSAQCADHITMAPANHYEWVTQAGGVLFSCDELADADCAALYSGFVPDTTVTDATYQTPLPLAIQNAIADFKQFMPVANGTATNAQRDALIKDLIRCVNYLNQRITNS